MKKLLYISALVFCSNTYAECQIMTSSDTELTQAIRLNKGLDLKYYSELCEYPHPRSLEGIKLNAQYNGMRVGKKYVEAFKCIRIIK